MADATDVSPTASAPPAEQPGFVQERRAEAAVRSLMELVSPTADVLRDGEEQEIESAEVVPGDIVLLGSGQRVRPTCSFDNVRKVTCFLISTGVGTFIVIPLSLLFGWPLSWSRPSSCGPTSSPRGCRTSRSPSSRASPTCSTGRRRAATNPS
jgi:hypothetical protein